MNKQIRNFMYVSGAWLTLMLSLTQAHAAPGMNNDICGASDRSLAYAAVFARAHFLRDTIWPEHAETILRLQGMQAKKNDRDALSAKRVRAAMNGVSRAAREAFAGNPDLHMQIESSQQIPTLVLTCTNLDSEKTNFTSFDIPLSLNFLQGETQQIEVRTNQPRSLPQ